MRLHKGRYEEATVYADDPAEMARRFAGEGARWLHVVDLDGARAGAPVNVAAVEAILSATDLSVQVGGGIRSFETATRWLRAGASRFVVGTAAVKDPDWVRAMCTDVPGGVVVAIDARGGEVAVEGWLEGTGRPAAALAEEIDNWGPGPWGILYTNIDRVCVRLCASCLPIRSRNRAELRSASAIVREISCDQRFPTTRSGSASTWQSHSRSPIRL